MGSKPNSKPPSFNFDSSKSIASPLQPKLPKIPTGLSLLPSDNNVPSALTIGVGACPPKVGDPIKYPSAFWIDFTSTSLEVNSQLILSTSTEVLFIPFAKASPMDAVFPYALA